MFEDLIKQLEDMGLEYTEGDNDLTIDISNADKTDVIDLVSALNNGAYSYTISDTEVVVTSTAEPVAPEAEEAIADEDIMNEALDQYGAY